MSQDDAGEVQVFVEMLPSLTSDRKIRRHDGMLAVSLESRTEDIKRALEVGARAVSGGLDGMSTPSGWEVNEVSAAFGISLTAEAGVVISKATTGATLEVTVKFARRSG